MSPLRVVPVFEPLQRVGVELVVAGFFEAERPLRGAAGWVDWRLCGALSRLLRTGHVSGVRGDAVLIPSGGGLRAPRVLALGLGSEAGFEGEGRRSAVADALERALALRVRSLALPLLSLGEPTAGAVLGAALDAVLAGARDGWEAGSPAAFDEVTLALVAAPGAERAVIEALRARVPGLSQALRIEASPERGVERVPAGPRTARTGS